MTWGAKGQMPLDKYTDEDEDGKSDGQGSTHSKFTEFECPTCNALNPSDLPFGAGEEVLCNYCGSEFVVKVTDQGKLKLREI